MSCPPFVVMFWVIVFDYALFQYYSKAKVSIEEIKNKNKNLSSSIIDLLNEAIGVYTESSSIPKAIIEKSIDFIRDSYFRMKYKDEIEEIKTLDEFEIFERLPYYLGLCITHSADSNVEHTIFLDSYESLYSRTYGKVSSQDNMAWLKELFLACKRVLFVIASRDRIRWDKEDPEWKNYLNQHRLSNLSEEDSRWFLEHVPICSQDGEISQEKINNIIKHANGVPLYLDLCVGLYEHAINHNILLDFKDFKDSKSIIERYIRHLNDKDKVAVGVLAILKSFSIEFGINLLKRFNLFYHLPELDDLLEKSIFIQLEDGQLSNQWKVDESVRSHIYEYMTEEQFLKLITEVLLLICEERKPSNFQYLISILDFIIEKPIYISNIKEELFEIIEYYATIGYWNEIHDILTHCINDTNTELQALAVFAELIWFKRTGRIESAIKLCEQYSFSEETMGRWYYMYSFIKIHFQHLSGEYEKSLVQYKELLDKISLIKACIPRHIYNMVAIKYADLLFLRGDFEESLKFTNTMLENEQISLEDKVELLRIKGHIYRFKKEYLEADLIYSTALKEVKKYNLKSLEGKLYTNLAETWCMDKPQDSITWCEKALAIHNPVENIIEKGKVLAAESVAYTQLGKYDLAIETAQKSQALAIQSGYKAGEVFALAALAYAQEKSNNLEESKAIYALARKKVEELKVYQYILPKEWG